MTPLQVLDALESTPGKNDKVKLLKEHKSEELSDLLHAALSFSRKFNIKKWPAVQGHQEALSDPHSSFMELLDKLEKRLIVGNEACQAVDHFMASCDEQQAKWYARVIRKDLQAGFSESTANKAGYKIPKFDVMLAKDGKNSKQLTKVVSAGGWISPKLDGYRCLAVKEGDDVRLYSRNGKEYTNFPSIIESIKQLPDTNLVLDGEIMSDDFQSMQKTAFSSKSGKSVGDVQYHIFDKIPYDEWISGDFKMPAGERFARKAELDSVFTKLDLDNLKVVAHIYVDKMETINAYEVEFTKNGYEGAMFLPDNCPYFRGRKSNKLMKFKTMLSMDCEITGVYEGINKYTGMLGGLNLVQENNMKCDCGSGFTDAQREEFYDNTEMVIGRIVEVKYQELTPDGVMRFPIFMRFRDIGANTGKI